MKFKMKSLPLAVLQVVATGALGAVALPSAFAQEQVAPEARVVITGSLISRTDKETASPVQVLTAEDLAKTGYTSVSEVLARLASNGAGALGTGHGGAFANGGAGVSLRGLTVGLTLVLIDGHRMAPYPLSDDAQRQFVDVSSIPFDAVDRIEVLKDGASSVYGSDAVAGVVNVILKKSFKGTTLKSEIGNAQHGGGKSKRASITHGFGDLANDGWNAFGSIEYKHSDAIKLYQRDNQNWANGDWSVRGGTNLTRGVPTIANNFLTATNSPFFYRPGTGGVNNPANFQFLDSTKCNYNLYMAGGCAVRDMVSNLKPESTNLNLLAGFTTRLGEDWQLAIKASQFRRESTNNRGVPVTFSPTSFLGNTALVPGELPRIVNVYGSTLFPATYPLNQLGAPARLYGYIPGASAANETNNTSTARRLAVDLTGTFAGWDIGAAAGITSNETDIDYSGYVNRVALYQALNRPTSPFNPLGGNSTSDIANILPRFNNVSTQKLQFAEVHGSREIAQFPGGGAVSVATGLSWTHKELNAPPPSLLSQGTVASGSAYVFGEETNTAVFGEISALVRNNLEVSAAARYDHYDTYGNSFTPSAKVKWSPVKNASLRATFAKGFRAPNAAEVGTASSFFVFHSINDPILCADAKPGTAGNVPTTCSFSPPFVQVTSPNLEPEKSTSFTLGLVIEPIKNLSATIDYYNIEVKNQINTAAGVPGFVPDYVRNAIFPVDIADGKGGTAPGLPSVGTIAYATSGYVNSGGNKTSGVELDLAYRHNFGEYGNFRGNLVFNHMISYELDSNGVKYELAGTHGPSVVSGNTGNPKNRVQLTLGWDRGPLSVTTSMNHVGSYSALDPSVEVNDCAKVTEVSSRTYYFGKDVPAAYCRINSFTTTDLSATYKVTGNLSLKASILNLFDKAPPIDVATYGNTGNLTSYNSNLHQSGAVGRYFSLGANYSF